MATALSYSSSGQVLRQQLMLLLPHSVSTGLQCRCTQAVNQASELYMLHIVGRLMVFATPLCCTSVVGCYISAELKLSYNVLLLWRDDGRYSCRLLSLILRPKCCNSASCQPVRWLPGSFVDIEMMEEGTAYHYVARCSERNKSHAVVVGVRIKTMQVQVQILLFVLTELPRYYKVATPVRIWVLLPWSPCCLMC